LIVFNCWKIVKKKLFFLFALVVRTRIAVFKLVG